MLKRKVVIVCKYVNCSDSDAFFEVSVIICSLSLTGFKTIDILTARNNLSDEVSTKTYDLAWNEKTPARQMKGQNSRMRR